MFMSVLAVCCCCQRADDRTVYLHDEVPPLSMLTMLPTLTMIRMPLQMRKNVDMKMSMMMIMMVDEDVDDDSGDSTGGKADSVAVADCNGDCPCGAHECLR